MSRLTRHVWLVVGVLAALALAFVAVGPVYAQDGTSNQSQTYTTQQGDTLGDVLGMAGIDVSSLGTSTDQATTAQLRQFFDLNPDLAFVQNAQVNVPDGVSVTGQEPAAGQTLTLGSFLNTYNLDSDANLNQFVAANQDLELAPDQTVQFPSNQAQSGNNAGQSNNNNNAGQSSNNNSGQSNNNNNAGQTNTYTVQQGDTLTSIADQYGITLEQLIALNPDLIQPGDNLVVPAQGGQSQVPVTGNNNQQGQAGSNSGNQSNNQSGQTNNQGNIPQTGAALSPWGGSQDVPGLNLGLNYDEVGKGQGIYIVQNGDTLSSIANRFGMTVPELWAMNPSIENPNVIYRGQRIRVMNSGENLPSSGIATQSELDRQMLQMSPNNNSSNSGNQPQ